MTNDAGLVSLYSQRILALAADIPHLGRLAAPQASATKRSPLCGSTVTVDLDLAEGRIARFGQDVKACALGQASAAVFGAHAIGRTKAEVETLRNDLQGMLKYGLGTPAAPFGDYEVLRPAREFRNRHASILLVLDATLAAMEAAEARASA